MDLSNYEHIKKVWGQEIVLTNNDKYCAKLMIVQPGFKCSLHRHLIKDETFFILEGTLGVELTVTGQTDYTKLTLTPGQNVHLDPKVYHRFWAESVAPVVMLEVSTPHSDNDVERLEESKAI